MKRPEAIENRSNPLNLPTRLDYTVLQIKTVHWEGDQRSG